MEEATELFSIQQAMMRAAQSAPTPPPPPPDGSPPPPPPAGLKMGGLGEDADWLMFLGLGLGAGLAAALVKRMSGDPPNRRPPTPPTPPKPAPST
jgi:hypothetical protein